MKKIKQVVYILVFVLIFNYVGQILSFKYGDGILSLEYMYEQENIDILVLGSSHAFEDINTATLYDEFGYAAYIAGGSIQPYWNSYYYLLEVLEIHEPELVVLEAYGSVFSDTYSDHSRIIKNNLGIQDYSTRYDSLMISAKDSEIDNYLLSYRLWHSRYEELSNSDFSNYYNTPTYEYYKGFGINYKTNSYEEPLVDHVLESFPMTLKTEEYYLKIIELCKSKNIPLMIVVSPYILSEQHQKIYNYSNQLALQYDIPFINFNSSYWYDKMGLNFETDFADPSHLNYLGNVKYTKILGEEISKLYTLQDRRGQEAYASYDLHSKDVNRRITNFELTQTISVSDFIDSIAYEEDYQVFISFITDSCDSEMKTALSRFPILADKLDSIKDGDLFMINGESLTVQSGPIYDECIYLDSNVIQYSSTFVNSDDILDVIQSMAYNGKEYIDEQKGCYIMVYDKFEKNMVTVKQLTYDDTGNIILNAK